MAPNQTAVYCSKEKELGEMAADIRNIKKDMTEMKSDNKEILSCIHSLKEELPKVYATNEKVDAMEKRLIEADKSQDKVLEKKVGFIAKNWFQILQVAGWTIIALIIIYGKTGGA